MATVPQKTVQDAHSDRARQLLSQLAPLADSLSKGVAALAIAMYVCGFLTVSLHHANYGFVGTNPFRPRILAAGAWFMFFTAIPVAVATRYRQRGWISIAASLGFVLLLFYGFSNVLFYLLFDLGSPHSPTPYHRWSYWAWGTGALIAAVLYSLATRSEKVTVTATAVASGAFVLFALGLRLQGYLLMRDFESSDLALWFFGIFMVTVLELKTSPGDYSGDRIKGLGTDLFLIFTVLLVFGRYYYPHIRSSWGGGAPVAVTIYFTKDSAIKPGQSVSAQLVEESDEGFYIVGQRETKAVYVPRSAVALVYFSDSALDSSLLTHEGR
ncbi:MAG TPA: hypothetical protein VMB18_00825 [Terriglobales bacterium]|nr:hypothetical protein [Terriglobales bacterium]